MKTDFSRQLQHGLSLTSDHKLRGQTGQDHFLYQKENLLKMQLPGLTNIPGPGVMMPPHFQGGQFPGPAFHFRGFPGNFGPGRLPPMRWLENVSLAEISDDRNCQISPGLCREASLPGAARLPSSARWGEQHITEVSLTCVRPSLSLSHPAVPYAEPRVPALPSSDQDTPLSSCLRHSRLNTGQLAASTSV